jgi:hypothetical protein
MCLTVILIIIPLTVGGIGLRESTLVVLLRNVGIGVESAVAMSSLVLLTGIAIALVGGLVEFYATFYR